MVGGQAGGAAGAWVRVGGRPAGFGWIWWGRLDKGIVDGASVIVKVRRVACLCGFGVLCVPTFVL